MIAAASSVSPLPALGGAGDASGASFHTWSRPAAAARRTKHTGQRTPLSSGITRFQTSLGANQMMFGPPQSLQRASGWSGSIPTALGGALSAVRCVGTHGSGSEPAEINASTCSVVGGEVVTVGQRHSPRCGVPPHFGQHVPSTRTNPALGGRDAAA